MITTPRTATESLEHIKDLLRKNASEMDSIKIQRDGLIQEGAILKRALVNAQYFKDKEEKETILKNRKITKQYKECDCVKRESIWNDNVAHEVDCKSVEQECENYCITVHQDNRGDF